MPNKQTEESIKKMQELLYDDIAVEDMPPPKGVSKKTIEQVREPADDENLREYAEHVRQVKEDQFLEKKKVPTFIEPLDEVLEGGLQGGELFILSAPTKSGKSLLAQTISYNQGKNNLPSLWLSLELSWQELTRRFMEMDKQYQDMQVPTDIPLWYPIDNKNLSLKWLEGQIIKAKKEKNISMVYIDHLHFLLPLKDFNQNISFLVGGIVRELKKIAIRHDIPILLITHMKKEDIDKRVTINSIRDCLPRNALVYSNGKRIQVKDLKEGMSVVSKNSLDKLQCDNVKKVWRVGKKEMVKVKTKLGREMVCSEGHKFLATTYKSTDKFGSNQGAGWTKVRDLEIGQKIAVPAKYPEPYNCRASMSEEKAIVLGWIIGDGYITQNSHTEKDNKHVPEDVFGQPDKVVAGFLRGLFQADGSVSYTGQKKNSLAIILSTISKKLAYDVQHLLLRFGILSIVKEIDTDKSGFKSSVSVSYIVRVRNRDVNLFVKYINFLGKKKVKMDKMFESWEYNKGRQGSDIYFDRVVSIEPIGKQEAYDVAIVGHHNSLENNSFCVDDFITHNSSFISQESDFTVVMWRQRKDKQTKMTKSYDPLDDEEVYENVSIVSLEANRRNGKTKKFALEHVHGMFYTVDDARVQHMQDESTAADTLYERQRRASQDDDDDKSFEDWVIDNVRKDRDS